MEHGRNRVKISIPTKRNGKARLLNKICSYDGCGKEYMTESRVQKYCHFHSITSNRKRIRKKPESVEIKNQLFKHSFMEKTVTEFTCAHDGCCDKYSVVVYPKQFVYPKYCEEHRNEYKRKLFSFKSRPDLQAA